MYRFCDLAVRSNAPLPELRPSDDAEADVEFRWSARMGAETDGAVIQRTELADGSEWLVVSRLDDGSYRLRFPELATFEVSADAKEIRCGRTNGTPAHTVRHLLLDQVMPLVAGARGRTVIHASVIALGSSAVAFVGESGMGKSTLAGALVARGGVLLSDDCLVMSAGPGDGLETVPSYPGLRLWPDVVPAVAPEQAAGDAKVCHYSRKARVDVRFDATPMRLRRVFLLGRADEIAIEPIAAGDAMLALMKGTFLMDPEDRAGLQRSFLQLGRIAGGDVCRRLVYPRELGRLAELCEAVEQEVRGVGDAN